MAALDFTSRAACLAVVTDALPDADQGVIEALLDASAGLDCSEPPVTVYRPFWVQSTLLTQADTSGYQSVTSAAGSSVVYRAGSPTARAVMKQQAALDQVLCHVPVGFEASAGTVRVRTVF